MWSSLSRRSTFRSHAGALYVGVAALLSLPNNLYAAEEFHIAPCEDNKETHVRVCPNYLLGIKMASDDTLKESAKQLLHAGKEHIHLEADVSALAGETHGFKEGHWIPYLTIDYTLVSTDGKHKTSGTLKPMVAKDGPHYADTVHLPADAGGQYTLTYKIHPPEIDRHVDSDTGVPVWSKTLFEKSWTFTYPVKK